VSDNPLTWIGQTQSRTGNHDPPSVLRRHVNPERRKRDEDALARAHAAASAGEITKSFLKRTQTGQLGMAFA
jgi:hypothetical protein